MAPDLLPLNGWYPVAFASALSAGPARVIVQGRALVVWRNQTEGASVFLDRCPHRGAPLSSGTVLGDTLACPYHGWRFNRDGACVAMPALQGDPVAARASTFPAAMQDGIVFAGFGDHAAAPDARPLMDTPHTVRPVRDIMPAALIELAENILDTTHTSVVHARYLRRSDRRRAVQPIVKTGPDWIETHYPADASPSGLVGRLIGAGQYQITDRFRAPAIAEVDYRREGTLDFRIRFDLSPQDAGSTHVFARLAVRGTGPMAALKAWGIERMLDRIVAQDREILQRLTGNQRAHAQDRAPFLAPQDFMRAGIDAILRGKAPQPVSAARSISV